MAWRNVARKAWKPVASAAAIAAAPFTGGQSLYALPVINAAPNPFGSGGGGGVGSTPPGAMSYGGGYGGDGGLTGFDPKGGGIFDTGGFPDGGGLSAGAKAGGGFKEWLKGPMAAVIAGSLLSGIGKAIAAGQERKGAREIAQLQALGPIRGGSLRAGNQAMFQDPNLLARLGEITRPRFI